MTKSEILIFKNSMTFGIHFLQKCKVYISQGRHERQDHQDRGLAWILRNRMQRRHAGEVATTAVHCGGLACQKYTVAVLKVMELKKNN